jgi:hypothetical protein
MKVIGQIPHDVDGATTTIDKQHLLLGDLTSIVAGTGLNGTNLTGPIPTLNVDTTLPELSAFGTATTPITITSDTVTFTSANADDPTIIIENTAVDDQAARLQFKKHRGVAAVDGDNIGEIDFWGYNDGTPTEQMYGKISVEIQDSATGTESGIMYLSVANVDGGVNTGLKLYGGNLGSYEIDAEIGRGASSITSIQGTLSMGSTAAMTNAGLLSVGAQTNITSLGTLDWLKITSDSSIGAPAIDLTHNAVAQPALSINAANTTSPIVDITATHLTTAPAIYIRSGDTTKSMYLQQEITTVNNLSPVGLTLEQTKASVTNSSKAAELYGVYSKVSDTAKNNAAANNHIRNLSLESNMTHPDGTTSIYGIYNIVTGSADKAAGIYSNVANTLGPDIWMVDSADTTNYCQIGTLANGALNIVTHDQSGADANVSFTVDGTFAVASTGIDIAANGTITNATWQGTAIDQTYLTGQSGTNTGDQTTVSGSSGSCTGNAATATTAGTVTTGAQPNINQIGTDGDTLTLHADNITAQNTTTSKPALNLINQTDDSNAAIINLIKQRYDAGESIPIQAGEANDLLGKIYFQGYDNQSPPSTPGIQTYATIVASIHDPTQTEESGQLLFQIANHDGGLGNGLKLIGGSQDNEIDVNIGLGADSSTIVAGNFNAEGYCNIGANKSYNIDDTEIISDSSSGTATLKNIDALDATTAATIKNAATHAQIINLKGYGTVALNYQYPEDSADNQAPFQLAIDYTASAIADSVTIGQSSLFRASGFHFPFACVLDSIQYQATVNNSSGGTQGNITVALVQYVPRETGTNDYFRATYDEQEIVGIGTNNRVKTVDVSSPGVTAIAAGSHMMLMFKGDSDSVGDTAVISVAMKITY